MHDLLSFRAGHSMADELDAVILAAASEPKEATVDGTSVTAHSLKDMVEAAKYLDGNAAVATPHRGIRITKLVPEGAR